MMQVANSSPIEAKYRLLYVGNDLELLEFVRGTLRGEGWLVVRCPDGVGARVLLRSGIRYAVLMFNEELTGDMGRELARFAGALEHRKGTPVILLAPEGCAAEAGRTGERVFVRRPEQFHEIAEAVRRLVDSTAVNREEFKI